MAVEPLWTATELVNLASAVKDLEESLQAWEQEHDLKVADVMLNIDTLGRDSHRMGLVTMRDFNDTTLQFEAIDAEMGPV